MKRDVEHHRLSDGRKNLVTILSFGPAFLVMVWGVLRVLHDLGMTP